MTLKIMRLMIFFFLFVISALTGFTSGGNIAAWDSRLPEQHNILIVSAEELGLTNSRLRSVWLFIFYTDSPRADLLPIFPQSGESAESYNQAFASSFSLSPDGEPAPAFWSQMEALDTWWDGYIVLDDTASRALLSVGRKGRLTPDQNAQQDLTAISSWYEDPHTAQVLQSKLFQTHCKNLIMNSGIEDFVLLAPTLRRHVQTNLNFMQATQVWWLLQSYGKSLTCTFPTIAAEAH